MEFIDLKAQYNYLKEEIDENVASVMRSAKFIGGSEISQLEEKLKEYVGRKYCITCGNGTEALQLAYMALGIKAGDAILCPDMTFIASVEPACLLGAIPIFVDIELDSYNMDPADLEKKIRNIRREGKLNIKAVVSVDFLGNPAKYNEIKEICDRYGIYLIEDAAQSMGASYRGKKCCSFGDIACTSFFPSKPLGCYGDGGAIFTDNDDWAQSINSFKVHGKGTSKYDNVRIGMNSRLDTMQAAVLLAKFAILEEEIEKRQKIAKIYTKALEEIVKVPIVGDLSISSFAQYCVLFNSKQEREYVARKMEEAGIPTLVYYPRTMHSLVVFKDVKKYNKNEYRNAIQYAECNLGLPFSPYPSKEDKGLVVETLKNSIYAFREQ